MPQVEIVPYNPEWPEWFLQAKKRLKETLGSLAISIDHIGSTSVPSLGSKNRIDIQITVAEISDASKESLDEKLVTNGFSKTRNETDHRPPGDESPEIQWRKFYLSGTHPSLPFRTNIHIRARGAANQIYPLLFRDYLRKHVEARDTYFSLKKALAEYLADDSEAYTVAKDPGCDLVMISARDWARRNDWRAE
jgi:GrpB-like predicted nucleotidyltransferase (UPF0157 family)